MDKKLAPQVKIWQKENLNCGLHCLVDWLPLLPHVLRADVLKLCQVVVVLQILHFNKDILEHIFSSDKFRELEKETLNEEGKFATGETSKAITPYHFFKCPNFLGFYH